MSVLYRDEAVAAVDKPAGIPSDATRDPEREHALGLARRWLGLGPDGFLGLPHRLDRDTSGVLLLALTPDALRDLGAALQDRTATKVYAARVLGRVERDEQRVESFLAPIGERDGKQLWGAVRAGGKKAITLVKVLSRGAHTTLVECTLLTGRTHQARVHLAGLGHPIVGDELYGPRTRGAKGPGRHLLHAWRVRIPHPGRAGVFLEIEAPLPAELDEPSATRARR